MKLTPVDQHPEITPLDNKIALLASRKTDLEERLQKALRPTVKDAVDELLADPAATLVPGENPDQLRQELVQVQQAINRLQQERASTISRLSQEVCLEHTGEHKKRVLRILDAAKELTTANTSMIELFEELGSKGYSTGFLRVMLFGDTGSLSDPQSPLRIFERECQEFGFTDRKSWLGETVGANKTPASLSPEPAGVR